MICSFKPGNDAGLILKNMKSFTAMKLLDAIIKNPKESRKERRKESMLNIFETAGKKSSSNFRFKFWEHENHPVMLDSELLFNQKLNYLNWNPVTAGFVSEPWHWRYSSAIDYFTKKKLAGSSCFGMSTLICG